jgi:hypothetical protein
MQKLFTLFLILVLCGTFAAAQQTCTATTASVNGTYTYTATELPFGTTAITPPGTTTNQQPYSNTQIGNLIEALNLGGTFASASVLYFDGAGHISVSSSSSSFSATTVVGTYTVNSDCTISVSLTDVFNTTSTAAGTNPTQATASLIGIVLGGGTEIELSEAQSATSTNGNMPLAAGQFASRLAIQMIRNYAYGCTVASLQGSYGFVGSGLLLLNPSTTTTGASGTPQPVSVLAVLTFDGAGNILPQMVASGSPLADFQYKGTYTVNLNCSGTLTLMPVPPSTTTTTSTGTGTGTTTTSTAITASFVLTPPITYPTTNAYSASPSGNAARPGINFTLTTATETVSGYGIAQ